MLIFPFAGGCRFSPMLLGVVGVVGCDSLSFISLVTQPEKSSNLIWRIWPFKCHSDFRDLGPRLSERTQYGGVQKGLLVHAQIFGMLTRCPSKEDCFAYS